MHRTVRYFTKTTSRMMTENVVRSIAGVASAVVVILACLLVPPATGQEQSPDTTFLNRNIRQQLFLIDYLKDNKPERPPATSEEIDSYITGAEQAWSESVRGEDPLVGRLNAYVVMWLLRGAYAEADIPDEVECHAFSEFAVPAFLTDLERYSEIASVHAPLIHWPSHDWVGGHLALACELHPNRWAQLERAFERVPSVTAAYLQQNAYADERMAGTVRRVRRLFERNAPLYAIRGALYRGELAAAYADLAAATTNNYEVVYIRPLGEALWWAYAEEGRTRHALATLDLLARALTAGDLPRDSLRAWYAAVDSIAGPARFERMTAEDPAPLVPSNERADLVGTYTDLLAGETVELSELDLAALDDRLILLDFWATWCAPCIAEIPELRALKTEYSERLTFISVNADSVTDGVGRDGVRAFMDEHGIDYPVLYDEPDRSLVSRFRVGGYPAKFLIGPEGVLLVHPTDGRRTVRLDEVEAYFEHLR